MDDDPGSAIRVYHPTNNRYVYTWQRDEPGVLKKDQYLRLRSVGTHDVQFKCLSSSKVGFEFNFEKELEVGDSITVWVRAEEGGWTQMVERVAVTLFWAV